jgi:hypothetical protein
MANTGVYIHRQQGDLINLLSFLANFNYFEKIKVGLYDHHAVCVSVYPSTYI